MRNEQGYETKYVMKDSSNEYNVVAVIEWKIWLMRNLKDTKLKFIQMKIQAFSIYRCILFFVFLVLVFSCTESVHDLTLVFTTCKTNTEASLRGLFVVNEKVIWASGSEGTVLRSVDGGETWQKYQIESAEKNDFRSIHAWDENRALVFGVAGPEFCWLTENGGESWQVVFQDSTSGTFFNSLKFANSEIGLAVSDPIDGKPFVIKTSDGGKTWRKIENIPVSKEGEANFAASNTCIEFLPSGNAWIATGGNVARVFYSDDFGENWNVCETPMIQGSSSSGIFSVCFENDVNGVVVGGTYDKPEQNKNIAAFTTDGGKSWISAEKMLTEYRSCVQLVENENNRFYFAVGKTGCDLSFDGGKTWNFKAEENYYTFRAVPGKFSGFVAGSEGRIAKVDFE